MERPYFMTTARLGFAYVGDEFYPPTGLYHPSYILKRGNDGE